MSNLAKDGRIDLRVSAEHKELIEQAAEISGVAVSAFLLNTALEKARQLVIEDKVTRLSVRDAKRLLEILGKTESNDALKTAAKRYRSRHG